jgi:hypothetical protein
MYDSLSLVALQNLLWLTLLLAALFLVASLLYYLILSTLKSQKVIIKKHCSRRLKDWCTNQM